MSFTAIASEAADPTDTLQQPGIYLQVPLLDFSSYCGSISLLQWKQHGKSMSRAQDSPHKLSLGLPES